MFRLLRESFVSRVQNCVTCVTDGEEIRESLEEQPLIGHVMNVRSGPRILNLIVETKFTTFLRPLQNFPAESTPLC